MRREVEAPADHLLEDRYPVRPDLVTNPQSQHVVKAIVMLAQGFGRETIAEGVETQATLELLAEYGVNYAQGYAVGHPAPLENL